jgi:hypothetical protein
MHARTEICSITVFLDWKATAYALKPRAPRSVTWRHDPDIAASILDRLAKEIAGLLPETAQWILDVCAFGGFVDTRGQPTPEKQVIVMALATRPWTRRINPHVICREFLAIDHLLPSGGRALPALSRPEEDIEHAIMAGASACICTWRQSTIEWLEQDPPRHCPECGSASPADLCQPRQKLVDGLLSSHALALGRAIADEPDRLAKDQLWICSTDADFVPPLAILSSWGVSCAWLQPRPNGKYGYAALLTALGVRVVSLRQEVPHAK